MNKIEIYLFKDKVLYDVEIEENNLYCVLEQVSAMKEVYK